MNARRVAITGLGMVSPAGLSVEENFQNFLKGTSYVDTITHFDPTDFKVKIAAEIPQNANILLTYGGGSIMKNGVYEQVDDGLDLMIPVLEVQAQPGSSVILSDISFDLTSSYVLNRAERFWIELDYRLGFPADSLHPVYIVMQLQALGSDLSSPTANQNYAYTRLTDADAVRGVVSFLSANNHYMFAYYDANNDGIANTGDYGSETDPVNVSTLISPAGDAYITLSIGPSGIIP